jgi:3-oxoacyl-[acyl-carrier protein] reductase
MHDDTSRLALVVGGSRGIGRATALRLARSGFDIWLTYLSSHDAAAETRQEIEALGRRCTLMAFDVGDAAAVEAALQERAEETPPYAVVYNAGVSRDNLMVWMTKAEWDAVVRTDLDGFYNVIHCVLFGMLREKRGRIVAVSSVSGQIGQAGQANYSAAKAGIIGAAKALAREVGKRNIFVNVVAPGVIETEMTQELPREQILPLIPVGRIGTADEVAAVIDFLCSEPHMYVHGQVVGVSGGLAM